MEPSNTPAVPPSRPMTTDSTRNSPTAPRRVSPMARMTPISPVRSNTDMVMVLKMARAAMNTMSSSMKRMMPPNRVSIMFQGSTVFQASTCRPSSSGNAPRRLVNRPNSARSEVSLHTSTSMAPPGMSVIHCISDRGRKACRLTTVSPATMPTTCAATGAMEPYWVWPSMSSSIPTSASICSATLRPNTTSRLSPESQRPLTSISGASSRSR